MKALSKRERKNVLAEVSDSGISPPMQERSRKSLDRMLIAVEDLLKERTFEEITISDIASRAQVAVGSIYSRFSDKAALLVGLHRRIHERSEPCRRSLVDPERWENRSIESIVRVAMLSAIHYYRQHGDVLRAVSINAMPEVTGRVFGEISLFSAAMTDLIAAKLAIVDRSLLNEAIESIVRITIAVLMLRVMLVRIRSSSVISERRQAKELISVANAMLDPVLYAALAVRPLQARKPAREHR